MNNHFYTFADRYNSGNWQIGRGMYDHERHDII